MKGSERNKKCPCGSNKKWKNCCSNLANDEFMENSSSEANTEPIPDEVLDFFGKLQRDSEVLKKLGIHESYQQVVMRAREGYIVPLENSIFRIETDEVLNFYDIIGTIAMETFGNDWTEQEGEKEAKDRSEIYKIISILGATGTFKKIISYTGKKIGTTSIPESGFSKNFLTLAFDIFCLRRKAFLTKQLIERLKHFDQYQGARYEIAVAAIFCRLGYNIKWLDDRQEKQKHPEFIAEKDGKEIYVEAKSRHIEGVHNKRGAFDEDKAHKGAGWGSLVSQALKKQVPPNVPYLIFIDMNAINDGNLFPRWLQDVRKTLVKQHLKKYLGSPAPFTSVAFTNYSYHYQGLNHTDRGVGLTYENDMTARPYSSLEDKFNIMDAIKHYGFIPDFHIPAPMTILQSSSEYPKIKNIPNVYQ